MKKFLSFILATLFVLTLIPIEINASTVSYNVGDVIEFGFYPQSQVKDNSLLTELNEIDKKWISYNYHRQATRPAVGIVSDDYMQYADVEYNGEKYRAVTFSTWRPYITEKESAPGNTYQDANGYNYGTVYWFKFEPVKWRVLNPETGFVMSELVLDSQPFSVMCNMNMVSGYYYNSSELTTYANDYKTSYITKWLNNNFYNDAFTDNNKQNIFLSVSHDSQLTERVFLLSINEIKKQYGFINKDKITGIATDYAQVQGIEVYDYKKGDCDWWLRSHNEGDTGHANIIRYDGANYNARYTNYTSIGIRPAMLINLNSISPKYTLSYNANGGSNIPLPQTVSSVGIVSSVIPIRYGYTFLGWSTSATAISPSYNAGDIIDLTADMILYAVWQKNAVEPTPPAELPEIKINRTSTTTINYGETLVLTLEEMDIPEGYAVEWFVDGTGFSTKINDEGTEWRATSIANGSMTITAKLVDKNGEAVTDANGEELGDSIAITSKAGFWQKIVSFFKDLFRMNRIIY